MFAIAYSAEDTKESIQAALETLREKFQKMEKRESEAMIAEMMGTTERHQQKIAAALTVLTEEQRTKFDRLKLKRDIYFQMWHNHVKSHPPAYRGVEGQLGAWRISSQCVHNAYVTTTLELRTFLSQFSDLYELFF